MSHETFTFTGTLQLPDGSPAVKATGWLSLVDQDGNTVAVSDSADEIVWPKATLGVPADSSGSFSIANIPDPADMTLSPSGFGVRFRYQASPSSPPETVIFSPDGDTDLSSLVAYDGTISVPTSDSVTAGLIGDDDSATSGALSTWLAGQSVPAEVTDADVAAVLTPGTATTSAVTALTPLTHGPARLADDFKRADRLLSGDQAPSGHVYTCDDPADNLLVSGAYAPTPSSGVATVLYAPDDLPPVEVAAEVDFTAGSTGAQNWVVGCCSTTFAPGSVQLAVYPQTTDGIDWQLFSFNNPSTFTVFASGTWAEGFSITPGRRYRLSMRRIAADTVEVTLPDGTTAVGQHANIKSYWGSVAGLQLRRQNTTDGYGHAYAWATSRPAVAVQPTYGALLTLPGDTADVLACKAPATGPGDLDIRVAVAPEAWVPGAITDLIGQWGSGEHAFSFNITAAGALSLNYSLGGVTKTSNTSALSGMADGEVGLVAVTRTAADGKFAFYTSTTLSDLDVTPGTGGSWSKVASGTGTVGALDASTAPVHVGQPDTGGSPLVGTVTAAVVRSGVGGSLWAGVDFRARWSPYDANGNWWTLSGSGWSWEFTGLEGPKGDEGDEGPQGAPGASALWPVVETGSWYQVEGGGSATTTPNQNRAYLSPICTPTAVNLHAVAWEVVTGVTSAVTRVGLYDSDGAGGMPGTLLADWGTTDASAAGVKTLTLPSDVALEAGHVYFLAFVSQGAASVGYRGKTWVSALLGLSSLGFTTSWNAHYVTGVTGALASDPTIAGQTQGPCSAVMFA